MFLGVSLRSESESRSVVSNSLPPHALIQSMEFSRPEYWSGSPFLFPSHLLNPRMEPSFPILQAYSLPAEPQGKPKNTGVGNLSLLLWLFLTQKSNWGLLHCRWILYQLSYQGSPSQTDAAAAAKSLQSCSTLCDPIDGSPPGPAVPGILQARTLEWVAISFSNA